MPRPRISPSFVVAVLALVVASGGAGFAAGQITSAQIKDGTIRSRDVRDGGLTGADVRDRSIARRELDVRCPVGHSAVFGGCVKRASSGPTSYQGAINDCNRRNGRLPTMAEVRWIATHEEFGWADANPGQYEFTGESETGSFVTPIALDRSGNIIDNAAEFDSFFHHCVIS